MSLLDPTDLRQLSDADAEFKAKWISKAEIRLASMLGARGGDLEVIFAAKPEAVKEVIENAVLRVLRTPAVPTGNPLDSTSSIWFPSSDLDLLYPPRPKVGTIWAALPRRV